MAFSPFVMGTTLLATALVPGTNPMTANGAFSTILLQSLFAAGQTMIRNIPTAGMTLVVSSLRSICVYYCGCAFHNIPPSLSAAIATHPSTPAGQSDLT
jgi:hypothetical protein